MRQNQLFVLILLSCVPWASITSTEFHSPVSFLWKDNYPSANRPRRKHTLSFISKLDDVSHTFASYFHPNNLTVLVQTVYLLKGQNALRWLGEDNIMGNGHCSFHWREPKTALVFKYHPTSTGENNATHTFILYHLPPWCNSFFNLNERVIIRTIHHPKRGMIRMSLRLPQNNQYNLCLMRWIQFSQPHCPPNGCTNCLWHTLEIDIMNANMSHTPYVELISDAENNNNRVMNHLYTEQTNRRNRYRVYQWDGLSEREFRSELFWERWHVRGR